MLAWDCIVSLKYETYRTHDMPWAPDGTCIIAIRRRDQSRYAPSQLETSLLCNDVSHWMGEYLGWSCIRGCKHVCYCVGDEGTKQKNLLFVVYNKSNISIHSVIMVHHAHVVIMCMGIFKYIACHKSYRFELHWRVNWQKFFDLLKRWSYGISWWRHERKRFPHYFPGLWLWSFSIRLNKLSNKRHCNVHYLIKRSITL